MSIVFANLCQQLGNYQELGPPKISRAIMTAEDEEFAKRFKEWEIENLNIGEDFDEIETIDSEPVLGDNGHVGETEDNTVTLCCGECGREGMAVKLNAFTSRQGEIDDEHQQVLKRLQQAQQEGLNIDYRCPKCRSCSDCRRSFATERVSQREEAEDIMIWDSVNIDWKNKRIICYLPLRGSEEEFLSNNREVALKILDQQCYKYCKDTETKEMIVKALKKLMKNGQLVLWKDLTDEEKSIIESKPVSHYIPYRVVFKPSLSTPARPVFDGCQNTKARPDGTAGRCLNNAVVKGRVVTFNLLRMLLRFVAGRFALQGDLKQFYASIKLIVEQWNLKRVLIKEDFDPNNEVQEAVIKTLIWGIKCVSAQSECAVIKLAEAVKDESPMLSNFLLNSRFVDDLGDSKEKIETVKKLADDADKLFSQVGLECKGWSFTGSHPPTDVGEEDHTVGIGGTKWYTMLDLLEVPLPTLHFSKKARRRLMIGTEVFKGSMVEDMDKFVPKPLTRRQIFSKNAAIFDLLGKFTPITAGMKYDLRDAVKETDGWDDGVSDDLRSKWVKHFWRLETMKGIKFERAKRPIDVTSTKMDTIIAVDAAEHLKIVGVWVRFRLTNGQFSCSHLIGRALLADEDSTIPKNELDALTMG